MDHSVMGIIDVSALLRKVGRECSISPLLSSAIESILSHYKNRSVMNITGFKKFKIRFRWRHRRHTQVVMFVADRLNRSLEEGRGSINRLHARHRVESAEYTRFVRCFAIDNSPSESRGKLAKRPRRPFEESGTDYAARLASGDFPDALLTDYAWTSMPRETNIYATRA